MPVCPKCERPMEVDEVVSVGGVHGKAVRWRCASDGVVAAGVHPVQIGHLHVGEVVDHDGGRARILKLEMSGAELLVYREPLPAGA